MLLAQDQSRKQHLPALLAILIGAPAGLYVLKAWIDAGGAAPSFWRQALLIVSAAAIAGAGAWWRSHAHRRRQAPTRISPPCARRLADMLTLLGLLLLVGLLWMEVRQAAGNGAASLARTGIALSAVWGMLAGVVLQAAHLPVARAWDMHRLSMAELSMILQLSVVVFLLLPVNPPPSVTAWLAAVQTIGVTLFAGQIALQVLRRPGAAIMVVAAVLFYRALVNFVLAQQPDAAGIGAAVQFLALAPAGALDVAYAVRLTDADAQRLQVFALAAGISVALAAALIFWPQLPGVPSLTAEVVLFVVGAGAIMGSACGWCGAAFGSAARGAPGY